MTSRDPVVTDGVDERLPPRQLIPLALQHVLVMYAGAVAVPLVVGRALGLSSQAMTLLVSADLAACGIATLIQTIGLPGIGIRLPIMMGVTFASVSPMLALIDGGLASGRTPEDLLTTIYGAVIVAGLFGFVAAPFVGRLSRLFPPTVTGTVILLIGLSLMRIAINWAAGGLPGSPVYGALGNLGASAGTLALVLCLMRFGRGLVRSGAILIGVTAGTAIAGLFGMADMSAAGAEAWISPVYPFQFGFPRFDLPVILAMCLVMLVCMVESFGMFLAAGTLVGRPVDQPAMVRGLRADALGTLVGGLFNTFAYTSYAQNIGLLSVTGIRSRFVCAAGGVILILLGLCPKLAALAAAVPLPILGGAGLVMFGMIAATGIRILSSVQLTHERLVVVAVSVAAGLIPVLAPDFFHNMPQVLAPLLHSGIVLGSVTAVLLNQFFGHTGGHAVCK